MVQLKLQAHHLDDKIKAMNLKIVVYVLRSTNSRKTYCGFTNNFHRRLRQHNGIIKGGAKYTKNEKKGTWDPLFIVDGFSTKQKGLQFEWALKHSKKRGNGIEGRRSALEILLSSDKFKEKFGNENLVVYNF